MTCDWRKYFDLTGLPGGALAEASQKGHFAEKNVSAIFEGETIWSDAYPGNFHTVHGLQPVVLSAETAFEFAPGFFVSPSNG